MGEGGKGAGRHGVQEAEEGSKATGIRGGIGQINHVCVKGDIQVMKERPRTKDRAAWAKKQGGSRSRGMLETGRGNWGSRKGRTKREAGPSRCM